MQVRALGAHSSGIDILRAVHLALKQAIPRLLPGSKEERTATQCMEAISRVVHTGPQGKEDAVEPMQRVQEAIQLNRMNQPRAPMGGPPGGPPPPGAPPMPNPGPIPMAGATP